MTTATQDIDGRVQTGKYITETPRLLIREFTLDDTQAVFAFTSDETVTRYTGDTGRVNSLADAKDIIREIWFSAYQQFGYARWAVVLKETEEVIGFCGFKFDSSTEEVDLGYRLTPDNWDKGYATEANLACLEYAKQNMSLNHVWASVVDENQASAKVINKLGFNYVSEFQEQGFDWQRYELWLKGKPA